MFYQNYIDMGIKDNLRQYQQEEAAKRKAELEQFQQEHEDYMQSEQYQKDIWEHQQDLWEQKARKEGWVYTRKPFISTSEKQLQEQQNKQQEIAFLEAKLKALKGE